MTREFKIFKSRSTRRVGKSDSANMPRSAEPLWSELLFSPQVGRIERSSVILDYLGISAALVGAVLTVTSKSDGRLIPLVLAIVFQVGARLLKNLALHRDRDRESQSLQSFVETQRNLTKTTANFMKKPTHSYDGTFESTLLDNLVRCLDPQRKFDLRATLFAKAAAEEEGDIDSNVEEEEGRKLTFNRLAHSKLHGSRYWPRESFNDATPPGDSFIPQLLERGSYTKKAINIDEPEDPRYNTDNGLERQYKSFFNVAILAADRTVSHMLTCDSRDPDFFGDDAMNIIRVFAEMFQECFQSLESEVIPRTPSEGSSYFSTLREGE